MRRMVLRSGTECSAPGVFLTALTERVHSDGAISPGQKYFLQMDLDNTCHIMTQGIL